MVVIFRHGGKYDTVYVCECIISYFFVEMLEVILRKGYNMKVSSQEANNINGSFKRDALRVLLLFLLIQLIGDQLLAGS